MKVCWADKDLCPLHSDSPTSITHQFLFEVLSGSDLDTRDALFESTPNPSLAARVMNL